MDVLGGAMSRQTARGQRGEGCERSRQITGCKADEKSGAANSRVVTDI